MVENINEGKLNKLLELNKHLVLENNFSKRMELISNSIKKMLNVDRCTVFMHDENTKSFWSVYIDGVSYIEVPDGKGIASEVYKTKKTIILNDVKNNPLFNDDVDKGSGYDTKSILAVPIMGYGQKVLGVMQLINKIDGNSKFSEEDGKILGYVINHITAYLEIMT